MHLLLGLSLLFVFSKCRHQHHWLYCRQVPLLLVSFFLSAPLIFPLPSSFFPFFHDDFISLTTLHSDPSGRFLQHFNWGVKNNHLFFYSHWLCYNAATLSGQTRGQSIISPLAIQAAVWLLSAKHRDRPRLLLSLICLHTVLVFLHPSCRDKNPHKIIVLDRKKSKCFKTV